MKINSKYFQQLLNNSSTLSQSSKNFIQKVINRIKSNNDEGTDRQYAFLKRLETGNWKFKPTNESVEGKKYHRRNEFLYKLIDVFKQYPDKSLNAEEIALILNQNSDVKITRSNIGVNLSLLAKKGIVQKSKAYSKQEFGKFSGSKYRMNPDWENNLPEPKVSKKQDPYTPSKDNKTSRISDAITSVFDNGDKYNVVQVAKILEDKFNKSVNNASLLLYLSALVRKGYLETDKPKIGNTFKDKTYKYWKKEDEVNTLGIS